MSVSKKYIALTACGLLLLLPFVFTNLTLVLVVFIAYNTGISILLLFDYHLSPKHGTFIVSRPLEDTLYFKASNIMHIMVRNNNAFPVVVTVRDDIPPLHFQIVSQTKTTTISPWTEEIFSYEVVPSKRGNFLFENVYIRYKSIWGLCYKYFTMKLPMDFKVYPNLRDIDKYRLLLRRNRLLERGMKRLPMRGGGSEFESLREYVDGDDYRKINWMATARENKFILNQYEAEKNQPVFIMIDTGRAMSYYIKGYKKLDYAINAALILSDIVNHKGDQTGLLVFDTDVKSVITPGKGEAHRNLLMETLYHIADSKNTSDYEGAFKELINRQNRRGLVFVFTDFETLVESQDLIRSISILKKRHLPIVVLMKNESVHKIAETNADNTRGNHRRAVAVSMLDERAALIRTLNICGVACIESEAESFAVSAVNQYLSVKNRGIL